MPLSIVANQLTWLVGQNAIHLGAHNLFQSFNVVNPAVAGWTGLSIRRRKSRYSHEDKKSTSRLLHRSLYSQLLNNIEIQLQLTIENSQCRYLLRSSLQADLFYQLTSKHSSIIIYINLPKYGYSECYVQFYRTQYQTSLLTKMMVSTQCQ